MTIRETQAGSIVTKSNLYYKSSLGKQFIP